jgi:hypothetical protein
MTCVHEYDPGFCYVVTCDNYFGYKGASRVGYKEAAPGEEVERGPGPGREAVLIGRLLYLVDRILDAKTEAAIGIIHEMRTDRVVYEALKRYRETPVVEGSQPPAPLAWKREKVEAALDEMGATIEDVLVSDCHSTRSRAQDAAGGIMDLVRDFLKTHTPEPQGAPAEGVDELCGYLMRIATMLGFPCDDFKDLPDEMYKRLRAMQARIDALEAAPSVEAAPPAPGPQPKTTKEKRHDPRHGKNCKCNGDSHCCAIHNKSTPRLPLLHPGWAGLGYPCGYRGDYRRS